MRRHLLPTLVFAPLAALAWWVAPRSQDLVVDAAYHHLGDSEAADWPEAERWPEGTRLDLELETRANAGERVLALEQRHVDDDWTIELNGVAIGKLERCSGLEERFYPLAPGALADGRNRLSFVPSETTDDVVIGNVRILDTTFRELLDLRPLRVRVVEAESGAPSPARITIVDAAGELARLYYASSASTAVREGVVYTSEGLATAELPAGQYRVFATRGFEWGLAEATVTLDGGAELELALRREVDTTGFVACDTHVHTSTFSGHGDSSVEERMVTLAGEGVELAVSTDHNHNTDYRPYQARAGLEERFTTVVGNEVTTEVGHFNAFPLDPADEVPDHESTDYVKLVAGMRAKGAKVVILNHPRWPDHERGPFGAYGLDELTGARALPMPVTFDATEMINSTTEESSPMQLFRDWFALLNAGERVAAVGSSDSHTVGDPVGGGRTFVASSTDDPAAIDVDEACRNIARGRSTIGMGIFVDARVNGAAHVGDLARVAGSLRLELRVAAPSWVRPETALVYLNGVPRAEAPIPPGSNGEGGPTDVRLALEIDWPHAHDGWLVCVVRGAGIDGPFYPLHNDYTLGATNPIFLDADGDGSYSSPRATALARVERAGEARFAACDEAVVLQVLSLLRGEYEAEARARLERAAREAGGSERVEAYLRSLPPVPVRPPR